MNRKNQINWRIDRQSSTGIEPVLIQANKLLEIKPMKIWWKNIIMENKFLRKQYGKDARISKT